MILASEELQALAREVERPTRRVARNIVMEYDRKASDILKLTRAFVKQLDRHRAQMINNGYDNQTYVSELLEAEQALNEMMRKLG